MRPLCLIAALLFLPLHAAESPRVFPLWDGIEPVESYARRVNLPPTKQLDFGNNVTLDLVLIPAGQFIMGTPEPTEPSVTVGGAWTLCAGGGVLSLVLLLSLIVKSIRKRKFAFSLLWLLLFTATTGLAVGGYFRVQKAEKELARYVVEFTNYQTIPDNEKPAHTVTLTQPFYMGKYTVTQAQYEALMESNPNAFKGPQLPVDSASWHDAKAFCAKLNERLGNKAPKANLPTEAQWEFACRAGTTTQFYSGDQDSDLDAVAWYRENSGGTTHPVGTKKPNAFGIYDMHGHVWQWCRDAYIARYEELSSTDPFNDKGEARVLRGGTFDNSPRNCRSAFRTGTSPGFSIGSGFRVCVPLDF
ncbi:MAG TPA: formylglycine-generating enzyme family protein [Planctomycetota bacterium]|nr:formylglycine-generating enzyme family protein [Planctomycetota bacterium]